MNEYTNLLKMIKEQRGKVRVVKNLEETGVDVIIKFPGIRSCRVSQESFNEVAEYVQKEKEKRFMKMVSAWLTS